MSRIVNHVVWAIALALLAMLANHAPLANAALIASYNFNETSGTSAFDSSGNSHTATIAGGVTLGVTGNTYLDPANKAFQFDGVDDKVTRSANAAFAPGTFTANTGWSVETWFKIAPGNISNGGFISWYNQNGGTTPTYELMLDGSGHPHGWTRNDAGVDHGILTSPTDVRDNGWHHLSLVFGHDATNTPFRSLYLDGLVTASDAPTSLGTISGAVPLTMGWFDGYGTGDTFFSGAIDLVNIYSHALTAAQIFANYQAGIAPIPPVVPEPSTLALLGLGGLTLAATARRKRKACKVG